MISRTFCWLQGVFLYLAICGPSVGSPTVEEAPLLEWHRWSPAVFDQARREGRLVLVDLTAEWCRFCRKMDEVTYRDSRVLDVIRRHYLPVRVDEAESPEIAERYADAGRPATLVFDARGVEVMRKRGYLQPQWMTWMLEAVAAPDDDSSIP